MLASKLIVLAAAAALLTTVALAQNDETASPGEAPVLPADRETQAPPPPPGDAAEPAPAHFSGMDEAVNVDLAEKAGAPVRKPYLDVESLGDLWNLILLTGGAICGFIVGRYWNQIWGRPK